MARLGGPEAQGGAKTAQVAQPATRAEGHNRRHSHGLPEMVSRARHRGDGTVVNNGTGSSKGRTAVRRRRSSRKRGRWSIEEAHLGRRAIDGTGEIGRRRDHGCGNGDPPEWEKGRRQVVSPDPEVGHEEGAVGGHGAGWLAGTGEERHRRLAAALETHRWWGGGWLSWEMVEETHRWRWRGPSARVGEQCGSGGRRRLPVARSAMGRERSGMGIRRGWGRWWMASPVAMGRPGTGMDGDEWRMGWCGDAKGPRMRRRWVVFEVEAGRRRRVAEWGLVVGSLDVEDGKIRSQTLLR